MKDLLKYTAMGNGEQSAVVHSLEMLLTQCVDNWAMLDRKTQLKSGMQTFSNNYLDDNAYI